MPCRVRARGGDAFHEPSGLVARRGKRLDHMGEFMDDHAEVIGVVSDPLRVKLHAIATSECWHIQAAAKHQDNFFGPRPLVGGKESADDGVPLSAHFPGVTCPLHECGGVGDVGHVEDDVRSAREPTDMEAEAQAVVMERGAHEALRSGVTAADCGHDAGAGGVGGGQLG